MERTGRPRKTGGSGAKLKQYERVYAWKKLRAVIEANVAGGSRYHQRNRTLGMGATLSTEVEKQLVGWINELRADGVPVTSMMLKLQAQELYRTSGPRNGPFKASGAGENIFCAATSSLFAAEPEKGSLHWPTQSRRWRSSATKAKTVWVKCAGKSKERVTAKLLATSDGSKREPFLVFKTRPSTKPDVARENKVMRHGFGRRQWGEVHLLQQGVHIYGNAAGWWNTIITALMLPHPTPHAPSASDLGPLVRLLLLSNVALQAVDPAKDIDYNELDCEEDGAEGDRLAQNDAS
ncbi:uncharacterized protein PITG_17820 [Phytophthora infestans T30-4]|uniref:HTH CENPB-type domain-containing protein n=1 Tax=Phytophthora infestans (strain T30-4) TaxID=403677 RepID=D0NW53_PHYIT|nr:uncharacterized protein PITG_17820 [Phytophthora infestans T30-4]EEY66938.1 conserved hypothetical protein [Phytophthora infestans T30-4]|eukprot:XP_002896656.1 conserved hypothetical protein [Phytophthora infestans T30-4]